MNFWQLCFEFSFLRSYGELANLFILGLKIRKSLSVSVDMSSCYAVSIGSIGRKFTYTHDQPVE